MQIAPKARPAASGQLYLAPNRALLSLFPFLHSRSTAKPWDFFAKFKAGLQKTHAKLTHEIKRIVTRSPKLDAAALEELEAALIAADLGMAMTAQIVAAVKKAYETQGAAGPDVLRHRPRRS